MALHGIRFVAGIDVCGFKQTVLSSKIPAQGCNVRPYLVPIGDVDLLKRSRITLNLLNFKIGYSERERIYQPLEEVIEYRLGCKLSRHSSVYPQYQRAGRVALEVRCHEANMTPPFPRVARLLTARVPAFNRKSHSVMIPGQDGRRTAEQCRNSPYSATYGRRTARVSAGRPGPAARPPALVVGLPGLGMGDAAALNKKPRNAGLVG